MFDSVDRVSPDVAARCITESITLIDTHLEDCPWRVMITCRADSWEILQTELARRSSISANWVVVTVDGLTDEDLVQVSQQFPSVSHLLNHPHLRSVLRKPKILDMLVSKRGSKDFPNTANWLGESDLIEWFWTTEIEKSPGASSRARFAIQLAELQGDRWQAETPVTDFPRSELTILDGLKADQVCHQSEGRIRFQHDLYGDWSRCRGILANIGTLEQYLANRLDKPRWHRAIRLFAIHLLEQDRNVGRWKDALSRLSENRVAADLLIDASIFASNPVQVLELIWPILKDDPELFRRLLRRFLSIATFADPSFIKIAQEMGEDVDAELSALKRIPYRPYWIPMLKFLFAHKDDVLTMCPGLIAKISDLWLRFAKANWPVRKEAADLGISVAEVVLAERTAGTYFPDKKDFVHPAYRAALASIREYPNRVESLALIASGRSPIKENVLAHLRRINKERERFLKQHKIEVKPKNSLHLFSSWTRREAKEPWPDGPRYSVDRDFQDICLETDALYPLIAAKPQLAKEILLALLIERRMEPDAIFDHQDFFDRLGCSYRHGMYPPLYTQGPFLYFLKSAPKQALDFTIRLVDFTTGRIASTVMG